jgi:hypothetical protein
MKFAYEKSLSRNKIKVITKGYTMQTTEHLEQTYETFHFELNQLYKEFHEVPGYIRDKSGDELALQAAKKVFGRFNPDDKDEMESNTNNGQGFDVQLDDGTIMHLKNQLELYNRVVQFNKKNGGFCDENYIKHTNLADFKRLTDLQFKVETAKEALIEAFPIKRAGYAKAREIENRTKKMLSPSMQQGQKNTGQTSQKVSAAKSANGHASQSPKMRIPLFSSIPNTFRQARSMFNDSNNQHTNTEVAKYISSNDKAMNTDIVAHFNQNIAVATSINKVLKEPAGDNTEQNINLLTKRLNDGNGVIDNLINNTKIDETAVKDYSRTMKDKVAEMEELGKNHPLQSIRNLISNVVSKTLDALKNLVTAAKGIFSIKNTDGPNTD